MNEVADFLVAHGNTGFRLAGLAVLAVLIFEVIAITFGASLHMLDADAHADADIDGFLGWLNPGKMPTMLLMITFLGSLSIVGYVINWIWSGLGFELLPPLFITPIVGGLVLPIVAGVSRFLGQYLNQEDSNAITLDDLIGHYGKVTLGRITERMSGQAKFRDDYGVTHYVDVLAEAGKFADVGDDVVLLQRLAEDSFMFVIRKV